MSSWRSRSSSGAGSSSGNRILQHGRILQAFLTDQGRKVAEAVVSDAIAAHAKVFGVLTAAEQETLRDLLGRVIEQGTGHQLHPDHIGPE